MLVINTSGTYEGIVEGDVSIKADDVIITNSVCNRIRISTDNPIKNITIENSKVDSIAAFITNGSTLNGINIIDNMLNNSLVDAIRLSIEPSALPSASIDYVLIDGNKITDCDSGIQVRNTGDIINRNSNISIINNSVLRCNKYGIVARYIDSLTLEGNISCYNGKTNTLGGLWVGDTTSASISKNISNFNTTSGIDGNGILIDRGCRDIDVQHNTCEGNKGSSEFNSGAGIMCLDGDNLLLYKNILSGNKYDIWHGGESYKRSYSINNIYESLHYSSNLPDTSEILQ